MCKDLVTLALSSSWFKTLQYEMSATRVWFVIQGVFAQKKIRLDLVD